ncbi:MAG: helicase C-terminal domain-containing protein, partial [Pseudomonadota bacterium]
GGLQGALKTLAAGLFARLRDEAGELETADRTRIDAAARGLLWRAEGLAGVWRDMLAQLAVPPDEAFVMWFEVAVAKGAASDIGLRRHYVNPAERLAEDVLLPAGGAVITSATLRDAPAPRRTENKADGASADETIAAAAWASAERRLGLAGSSARIERLDEPSPFDYGRLSRVLVVTDVNRDNPDQIAGAYRALFAASGGGGLGLFTAIARLRAVHGRLIGPMAGAGLALYAQHVDAMETGALLDVFRTEEDACLLGTDAVRDGVDVPGRSLRLIVLDRTPWARPDILHKARRAAFGSGYDDMIVRSRLKQAFGRLIRRADDRGVFVMLDTRAPSRLMNAFPDGVAPERMGLAEACAETARFLGKGGAARGE